MYVYSYMYVFMSSSIKHNIKIGGLSTIISDYLLIKLFVVKLHVSAVYWFIFRLIWMYWEIIFYVKHHGIYKQ
jgi:hypothetical protein